MNTTTKRATRKIPITKPYFGTEEEQAVLETLRSGWIGQGPKVSEFESKFAEYVGAKHAVALNSCTTGLHLAMIVAGIQPGDEVICPSLSFIATANGVVYAGAKPVFVDVDPLTYNLDPKRIEAAITPRTRAILIVHQIGMPAAIDEIQAIATRHKLVVLEDAACALGATYRGVRIGAPHSALAVFSFHPRKVLVTGDGGMITTADGEMADRLRRLRGHAMSASTLARHSARVTDFESYDEVGFNYRMTDLQAALGIVQLGRMDLFLAKRRELAEHYTKKLQGLGWIQPPAEPAPGQHTFQSYQVRVLRDAPVSRNELMEGLAEWGVTTRRGVMAIHREPPFRDPKWLALLPETEKAADECLTLPLYHQMTEDDQNYVVEAIRDVGERGGR